MGTNPFSEITPQINHLASLCQKTATINRVFDSYIDYKVHQSLINSRFSLSINLF